MEQQKPQDHVSEPTSKITTSGSSSRWCSFEKFTVCPVDISRRSRYSAGWTTRFHAHHAVASLEERKVFRPQFLRWKSTCCEVSITVALSFLVRVESCRAWVTAICEHALAELRERPLRDSKTVVDLPICPPCRYTAITRAPVSMFIEVVV